MLHAATLVFLLGVLLNRTDCRRHQRFVISTAAPYVDDFDEDEDFEDLKEADDDDRVYKNPRNFPSAECPRDEVYAAFMGQKCLRKCSSHEDCKSKKKRCLCDGACGMSCIKPEKECPELTSPDLGMIEATGRFFNDKATYSCNPGYHLVGLKERVCRADGSWTGVAPTCKQNVFCHAPPEIENARHNGFPEQTTFDVDVTIQYQCQHGYDTDGFSQAKCLAIGGATASWFGPDISCKPRSCGPPPRITNGWYPQECYTFGCRVNYHCVEGFELVGRQDTICQADGTWFPRELPTCVPVQCPEPENPVNGKAIFTSTSYNSIVSYECRHGYTLSGNLTRRCGPDKRWSGSMPKCQEINCGHPGTLYNGWLENIESGTGLGASVIFRCHEGMLLEGNTSSLCLKDGTWRYPLPKCLAPCVIPEVAQGRVTVTHGSPGNVSVMANMAPHGARLVLHCEDKFEPSANNTPVICQNGTWSRLPSCQPARCKYLPKAPANGIVIAPKTDHLMRAKFKCKDGFVLEGESSTECLYGTWTEAHPVCTEVYCSFPGNVENGKVMLVGNMGVYDYRSYVRRVVNNKQIMYDCDRGYYLSSGPPGATCIGGYWSPKQLPKCVLGQHPRINTGRAIRSIRTKVLRQLQRVRRALSGQNSQVSMRKTVSGSSDKKDKQQGGGRRGNMNEGGDDDDSLYGGDSDKKEGRKHKNRGKGPCEPISTEPYFHSELIRPGHNENDTFSHGSIYHVICATGYGLNVKNNNTFRCAHGKWRPKKPECSLLPCPVPSVAHGEFLLSNNATNWTSITLNDSEDVPSDVEVEFSCHQGFNLQGASKLMCERGTWNPADLPECTPAPCELPPITHGQYLSGYRAGLTIGNGSSVIFTCDNEYIKSTTGTIECVLGELRPWAPGCKRDPGLFIPGGDILRGGELGTVDLIAGLKGSCGPPARVHNSIVFRNGVQVTEKERSFPDGTEITFNCIGNIMGEKLSWRIICEDGNWLGRSHSCDIETPSDHGSSKDNSTCTFRNTEPNVATFFENQLIAEDVMEFPAGTTLVFRCTDIGKYALIGSNFRKCVGGEWEGQKPSCFGLNQENDYALEKPPTILFRHQQGPIAQSNDGKLIVYPGTILHMECLWIRRFGTPKWNVSHSYRQYPEGWNADPGRDSQLEYRLSIFHASKDDSGVFTCETPTRHAHSIEIVVTAVHCPVLPPRRSLTISSQATKMNSLIKFTCGNGNALIGASEITCLPSGNWSAPLPVCESVECPDPGNLTDPNLRAAVISRAVGGQMMFSCTQGYGLSGPAYSTCQVTGEWSQPFPKCAEVECEWPGLPDQGFSLSRRKLYRAGDLIHYGCSPQLMLEGSSVIICQDSGRWSGPIPKCVQACPYPGTVISGRMSAVKFYYGIGETLTFTCDDNLNLQGASMIRCLRSGKWSNAIPACVPQNSATAATPSSG
ncbi:sushi, von Willebrand factor type A, EGF and pentraxin domain-containing protein 1 isoform X2 [Bemisia tabaci]|uniref:sushi, von Willebrand factor type A, EGF and pentraxin domain-containing protein 1 isoform X2 n=1 Tax=Bemisia tabaci TaxID=7038 RepID=UPI003B28C60A